MEVNVEITVRLYVLTANNVEIPCKIRDIAATVEISVGFGDSNGSECGDYCEIRCSNRKEYGDFLQDRDTAATVEIAVGFGVYYEIRFLTAKNVEIACKIRDTAATVEISVRFRGSKEVNVEITVRLEVLTALNMEITVRFRGSHDGDYEDSSSRA